MYNTNIILLYNEIYPQDKYNLTFRKIRQILNDRVLTKLKKSYNIDSDYFPSNCVVPVVPNLVIHAANPR